jgi:hypothetical protein
VEKLLKEKYGVFRSSHKKKDSDSEILGVSVTSSDGF